MLVEIGYQPGHSENYTILAKFLTKDKAYIAYISLARLLEQTQTCIPSAAQEARIKLGKEEAEKFVKEIESRHKDWLELFDTDWNTEEVEISLNDANEIYFKVYTAGNGVDTVAAFLKKMGGKVEWPDECDGSTAENVMNEIRQQLGFNRDMPVKKGKKKK